MVRAAYFKSRRQSVAKWKRAKMDAGLCGYCGAEPLASKTRCVQCLESHRLAARRWRTTADEKAKRVARESVRKGLRCGTMVKPDACSACGSDGELQAHHS